MLIDNLTMLSKEPVAMHKQGELSHETHQKCTHDVTNIVSNSVHTNYIDLVQEQDHAPKD
jgi:anti-anti-sigma regulatory factor